MGIEGYVEPILTYLNEEYNFVYFEKNKLIARDSSMNNIEHKSINKIFPSNHDYCAILDDRIDVWAERKSLIKIYPYYYFPHPFCSNQSIKNKVNEKSLNEDVFLLVSSYILKFIWYVFFYILDKKNKNLPVKDILTLKKREIFKNMYILILNVSTEESNYLKYVITSFGGVIKTVYDDEVNIVLIGEGSNGSKDNLINSSIFNCECLMSIYIVYCELFYVKLSYDKFRYSDYTILKEAKSKNEKLHNNIINSYNHLNMFNIEKNNIEKFYSKDSAIQFANIHLNLI